MKKTKRFLCYQHVVTNQETIGNTKNIGFDVVIRNVGAETKEEALGKFILKTSDTQLSKKLEPVCFELDDLMCIE